jgi:2'-5' RNA ligase
VSDRIRAFVAVPVGEQVVGLVRGIEKRLKEVEADVKWVAPENVHVTMKFLGNMPAADAGSLARSLASELEGTEAFDVAVEGTGTFPPGRKAPRVIWIGLGDGADRLAHTASRVEEVCFRAGFEREKRPFRAHLTIGRVRRGSPGLARLAEAVRETEYSPLKLRVDEVNLMRSELSPRGPSYTVLESIALDG